MRMSFRVELREGWQEAWREVLRFGVFLGWRALPQGLATHEGVLPYMNTGSRVLKLHPSEEAGALAALCLLRFFDPARVRVEPKGSMFALDRACAYLQRQGFPVDPWFVTERELVLAKAPRLGGGLLYAVEVGPGESLSHALGSVYAVGTGEVVQRLPERARPVGEAFPLNRVWLLEAVGPGRRRAG